MLLSAWSSRSSSHALIAATRSFRSSSVGLSGFVLLGMVKFLIRFDYLNVQSELIDAAVRPCEFTEARDEPSALADEAAPDVPWSDDAQDDGVAGLRCPDLERVGLASERSQEGLQPQDCHA